MTVVSATLRGEADPVALVVENAAWAAVGFPAAVVVVAVVDFICWIWYVMASVFIASRMLVVTVGSSARTVKVQSSWFW